MAISKDSTQRRDVNPDARFFDECLRPNPRNQFLLADKFACVLDERDKDEKCATAQTNRPSVVKKQLLRRKKAKWPERKTWNNCKW